MVCGGGEIWMNPMSKAPTHLDISECSRVTCTHAGGPLGAVTTSFLIFGGTILEEPYGKVDIKIRMQTETTATVVQISEKYQSTRQRDI